MPRQNLAQVTSPCRQIYKTNLPIRCICPWDLSVWQWGERFLNIAQRQMIENSGFHAHVRHRRAYGSQFCDPAPNWRTLMKLDPDPIISLLMRLLPPLFAFQAPSSLCAMFQFPPTADIGRVLIRGMHALIRAANLFHIAMLLPRYCGSKPPL